MLPVERPASVLLAFDGEIGVRSPHLDAFPGTRWRKRERKKPKKKRCTGGGEKKRSGEGANSEQVLLGRVL
ncbi:hypothetical protein M5K25_014270 [Dendrobium thyrsiflorum]|uniref:Uncharacterized protein n=1 Tax=Dendrobium thyrsiflorum TaxID=117978 RepID=A0ABD0UV95_DENTH